MFYKTITRQDRWGNDEKVKVLDTKKVTIAATIGAVLIIGLITLLISFCRVPTGHTGVVTSFGRVENYVLDEGGHFTAPWKRVVKMNNQTQKEIFEMKAFSSDTQEVSIRYALNYSIDKSNAMKIYQNIGKNYSDVVISPSVAESVKVVTAKYTAENLVVKRDKLAESIEKLLKEKLKEFNINVDSTAIEDIDFTDKYTNAVEAKQVALQNKLKSETEAEQKVIEAEANAEVTRIKAQGKADAEKIAAEAEAEANKMIAKSLNDNVLRNKWYEKWNGEYPQVVSGSGTIIEFPMSETKK